MDDSTKEHKGRADMKVSKLGKHGRADVKVRPRKMVKKEITKEQFLANLDKVCQPISKESTESEQGKSET